MKYQYMLEHRWTLETLCEVREARQEILYGSIYIKCSEQANLKPGWGRSHEDEKGNPLQYSGLENSLNCAIYGVTKSQTRLNDFHFLS